MFQRCAGALVKVLRGREDPLSLLFGEKKPTAADLYRDAPVWRAANRMLGEVVQALVAELPGGRALRVLEVGAGIGSATDCILPELPAGRFSYTYTDISAGFFAEAEARFGDYDDAIEYRVLDIERDPLTQGFDAHGYDLLIAANVLHATRYLNETLDHCRELLAPAGQLVALENQRGRGWMDLIFGQLDGWWRFADAYRPHHALAGSDVWRQALGDAGFGDVEVLGVDKSEAAGLPDRGVITALGPTQVLLPRGVWVLAADRNGLAEELGAELAEQNQTVILADNESSENGPAAATGPGVFRMAVEMEQRESWRLLLEGLPRDAPFHRNRAPRSAGWSRRAGNNRGDGGTGETLDNQRPGSHTGRNRHRSGPCERFLVRHTRGAGAGEGTFRGTRRRNTVGFRQGCGPGGSAVASAHDRPRPRCCRAAGQLHGRTALP